MSANVPVYKEHVCQFPCILGKCLLMSLYIKKMSANFPAYKENVHMVKTSADFPVCKENVC